MDDFKPNKENRDNDMPLVEIRSVEKNSAKTEIYINGQRINGVLSFSIEHDPMKNIDPVLTLRVPCNVDISLGAIPLLPAPWSYFYEPKNGDTLISINVD